MRTTPDPAGTTTEQPASVNFRESIKHAKIFQRGVTVVLFIISMATLIGCSIFGIRSGFEQVNYTVIESIDGIEIRRYPPRVVAEVAGVTDRTDAFMVLFRYISGENHARASVAMTTPVQIDTSAMKMVATTPIEYREERPNLVVMRFFLPRSITAATAPQPNDPRITIIPLPEETQASITYSGVDSEERFHENADRLLKRLSKTKWKPTSPPSFLGYDPPYTIPFLRRNEVVLRVEPRKEDVFR